MTLREQMREHKKIFACDYFFLYQVAGCSDAGGQIWYLWWPMGDGIREEIGINEVYMMAYCSRRAGAKEWEQPKPRQ